MTALVVTVVVVLLHALGIIAAVHALMHSRTPQGAIGWALSLVLLPYFTLLPYAYLGSSHFVGYDTKPAPSATRDQRELSNCARYRAIATLQQRPFRAGNQVRLLINGDVAFDTMLTAMANARKCLLIQFFIIRDDSLGRRLQHVLLERAAAGVRVCVLFDGIGSHALPHSYVEELRAGGVSIHRFAIRRWRNRFQLNFRNHRKILVVDGERGFVGGLNVGDEYLGLKPPLAPWRDTHLELRGPAVADLQQLFGNDWEWITGAPPPLIPVLQHAGNASTLIVASGPADAQESGSLFFTAAINAARHRVWLSTPYFVPDNSVRAALQLAALRGVDVRILIPSRPDHRTVFLSSTLHAANAICAGIQVFRYQPGFLHQKAMLIDGDTAAIGSMNLDSRSFRLNFEVMALTVDRDFASAVEAMLVIDFSQSLAVTEREYRSATCLHRVAMHVARLFDPLL